MILKFDDQPTYDEVSRLFEVPAPKAFVDFLAALHEEIGGGNLNLAYHSALCLQPGAFEARYPFTPSEFFPIGSTEWGGEHMGFAIHAPELELNDYPLVFITPDGSEGVFCIGVDAKSGLERVMSYCFRDGDPPLQTLVENIARRAGFTLSPDTVGDFGPYFGGPSPLNADGLPQRIQVHVPDGYRYVPSSDGIGVLAPKDTFQPGGPTPYEELPVYGEEAVCNELIDAGHAASALYYAREYLYRDGKDHESVFEIHARCYEALDRPGLAEISRRRGQNV